MKIPAGREITIITRFEYPPIYRQKFPPTETKKFLTVFDTDRGISVPLGSRFAVTLKHPTLRASSSVTSSRPRSVRSGWFDSRVRVLHSPLRPTVISRQPSASSSRGFCFSAGATRVEIRREKTRRVNDARVGSADRERVVNVAGRALVTFVVTPTINAERRAKRSDEPQEGSEVRCGQTSAIRFGRERTMACSAN